MFGFFNADQWIDLLIGFDDAGDAGSAWRYAGEEQSDGSVAFDLRTCSELMDINTLDEAGGSNPGLSRSARVVDVNFDGYDDILVGYFYETHEAPPSRTEVWLGAADGSMTSRGEIRSFDKTDFGTTFATHQMACKPHR